MHPPSSVPTFLVVRSGEWCFFPPFSEPFGVLMFTTEAHRSEGTKRDASQTNTMAACDGCPKGEPIGDVEGDRVWQKKYCARVAKRGPFLTPVEEGATYYYCTCGSSNNQPFCDGSHNAINKTHGTSFKPKAYKASATGKIAFCGCRTSANGLTCDGSHNNLPNDGTACRTPLATAYQPYVVAGVASVSHDTVRVTLAGEGTGEKMPPSYHFSCKIGPKSRPYTPISYDPEANKLELLVKKIDGGAVSPSVHALKEGDTVQLRGPSPGEYEVVAGKHKSLLLLAAGSGLTPILQIVQALCTMGEGKTEVVLVYSNKTEEDILLRDSILQLQEVHPNVLTSVVFCVTRGPKELEAPLHSGRVSHELLKKLFGERAKDNAHAVVCGTPEFNVACSEICAKIGLGEKAVTLS